MRPAHLASILFGLAGLGFLAGGFILRGLGPAAQVLQVIGAVFLVVCACWLVVARRRPASNRLEQGGSSDGA
jgi:hypothetical protein